MAIKNINESVSIVIFVKEVGFNTFVINLNVITHVNRSNGGETRKELFASDLTKQGSSKSNNAQGIAKIVFFLSIFSMITVIKTRRKNK
ncbi:MAG: hypothetical protein ACXAEU_12390 [Candidatus Hodarchaeales archaeon]|jgi:hypothetical protein